MALVLELVSAVNLHLSLVSNLGALFCRPFPSHECALWSALQCSLGEFSAPGPSASSHAECRPCHNAPFMLVTFTSRLCSYKVLNALLASASLTLSRLSPSLPPISRASRRRVSQTHQSFESIPHSQAELLAFGSAQVAQVCYFGLDRTTGMPIGVSPGQSLDKEPLQPSTAH